MNGPFATLSPYNAMWSHYPLLLSTLNVGLFASVSFPLYFDLLSTIKILVVFGQLDHESPAQMDDNRIVFCYVVLYLIDLVLHSCSHFRECWAPEK